MQFYNYNKFKKIFNIIFYVKLKINKSKNNKRI